LRVNEYANPYSENQVATTFAVL